MCPAAGGPAAPGGRVQQGRGLRRPEDPEPATGTGGLRRGRALGPRHLPGGAHGLPGHRAGQQQGGDPTHPVLALGVHQAGLQHVQGLAQDRGTSALGGGDASPVGLPRRTPGDPSTRTGQPPAPRRPPEGHRRARGPALVWAPGGPAVRGGTPNAAGASCPRSPGPQAPPHAAAGTHSNKAGYEVREDPIRQVPGAEDQLLGLVVAGQLQGGRGVGGGTACSGPEGRSRLRGCRQGPTGSLPGLAAGLLLGPPCPLWPVAGPTPDPPAPTCALWRHPPRGLGGWSSPGCPSESPARAGALPGPR